METLKKGFVYVTLLSVIAYSIGFINKILMSYYFGTSQYLDAFWVAMGIINILTFFSHPMREAVVPEYFRLREKAIKKSKIFFSQNINFINIIIIIIIFSVVLFPNSLIQLTVKNYDKIH